MSTSGPNSKGKKVENHVSPLTLTQRSSVEDSNEIISRSEIPFLLGTVAYRTMKMKENERKGRGSGWSLLGSHLDLYLVA
jgi:hypothetical protein